MRKGCGHLFLVTRLNYLLNIRFLIICKSILLELYYLLIHEKTLMGNCIFFLNVKLNFFSTFDQRLTYWIITIIITFQLINFSRADYLLCFFEKVFHIKYFVKSGAADIPIKPIIFLSFHISLAPTHPPHDEPIIIIFLFLSIEFVISFASKIQS